MIVREMTLSDLPIVMQLEESLYKTPWTEKMFIDELTTNKFAYLFVLCEKDLILGYYGVWFVADYATVTKVSVRKELQGKGLSNILMDDVFDRCKKANISLIDLEVRESNISAHNLYLKYGFNDVGKRKGYYSDGENAIAMLKILREGGEQYEKIHLGN